MDRIFLDANILFSAAYLSTTELVGLWSLPDTQLCVSDYVVAQAYRNLQRKLPDRIRTLSQLLASCRLMNELEPLPADVDLPENDVPVLSAAIAARCTHLLTGDNDFDELRGRTVSGVLILRPGDYLRMRHGA